MSVREYGSAATTALFDAPVRALVLDIDDTLVDTQAAMRGACEVGAAAAWTAHPAQVHAALSGLFYDDPDGHFDAYTRGELTFTQMRQARYDVACRELGLTSADRLDAGFEVFEAAYRVAFAQRQFLFPDALPLLEAADKAGATLCFVTNSGDAQTTMKLQVTGLAGRGEVVTTDTLGVGKPDPRIFEEARRRTGLTPDTTLVVGDTLGTDVVGGRAAGMRVAWLQRTDRPEPRNAEWGTPPPDEMVRVVTDLHQVISLLRSS